MKVSIPPLRITPPTALADAQQRVQQALQNLAPRERRLVIGGALVLGVLLAYLLIWEPLAQAHARRLAALDSARALAVRIEQAAALVQARQSPGGASSGSLLAVIDQSSQRAALGKTPSRVQPDGAGDRSVKVWFDDVPFDPLLRWIGELQTRHGVSIASAEFAQGSAAGLVNVQLTLSR